MLKDGKTRKPTRRAVHTATTVRKDVRGRVIRLGRQAPGRDRKAAR